MLIYITTQAIYTVYLNDVKPEIYSLHEISLEDHRKAFTGGKSATIMVYIVFLFYKLHWLLVCFQVQFKVLVLTFKSLHGMTPGSISS